MKIFNREVDLKGWGITFVMIMLISAVIRFCEPLFDFAAGHTTTLFIGWFLSVVLFAVAGFFTGAGFVLKCYGDLERAKATAEPKEMSMQDYRVRLQEEGKKAFERCIYELAQAELQFNRESPEEIYVNLAKFYSNLHRGSDEWDTPDMVYVRKRVAEEKKKLIL